MILEMTMEDLKVMNKKLVSKIHELDKQVFELRQELENTKRERDIYRNLYQKSGGSRNAGRKRRENDANPLPSFTIFQMHYFEGIKIADLQKEYHTGSSQIQRIVHEQAEIAAKELVRKGQLSQDEKQCQAELRILHGIWKRNWCKDTELKNKAAELWKCYVN